METFVVVYTETKNLMYVGQDVREANKWLEMPHYSKEEQSKYQLSIWEDGSLMNECITKKINEDRD